MNRKRILALVMAIVMIATTINVKADTFNNMVNSIERLDENELVSEIVDKNKEFIIS